MKRTEDQKYERHVRDKKGDYTVNKSRLFDNIALVVCLIIAVALWLYVSATTDVVVEETFEMVPIEVRGADELESLGLSVLSISQDTLNVTLKGTRDALSDVNKKNIEAYVDLAGIQSAAVYTLPVKFSLPSGVVLVGQSEVQVRVDSLAIKHFPVNYHIIRAESWGVADSCYIDEINATANIDHVVLEGPAIVLNRVVNVYITANSTITMTTSGEVSARIEPIDNTGEVIRDSSLIIKAYKGGVVTETGEVSGGVLRDQISVTLPVVKEKILPLVATDANGILTSGQVTFSPAMVKVKGTPDVVDAMTEFRVGSFCSKNLLNEIDGTVSKSFVLETLPAGIKAVMNLDGSAFTEAEADIKVGNTYELTVPGRYVTILGGKAELVDESITLKLRTVGDETYFLLLENHLAEGKDSIELMVNITDLELTGKTKAPLTVRFSSDFEGKVYEITEEGTSYMATVQPIE